MKMEALVSIVTALILACSSSTVANPQPQRSAKITVQKIKQTARDIPIVYISPTFAIDDANKYVHFGLCLTKDADLGPVGNLFKPLISAQACLAEVARVVKGTPVERVVTRQYVNKVETLVYLAVIDIESTNNPAQRKQRVAVRAKEIKRLESRLLAVLKTFAQRKGYTFQLMPVVMPHFTNHVHIVTNPRGGIVKVIELLAYKQCRTLGLCGNDWPWRTLVSDLEDLLGGYRYIVSWPDGKQEEGEINVAPNGGTFQTLTFTRK